MPSTTPGTPTTIVLATGNPHKVKELRTIFAEFAGTGVGRAGGAENLGGASRAISVIGLDDFPGVTFDEPIEHGTTFAENARIKALSYAMQIGQRGGITGSFLCLGDDSGIEIEALKLPDETPRPGVISSHYSTDGRETGLSREQRDAANNQRVLRELEHVPVERRSARFVCCMCLVRVSGLGFRVSGSEDANDVASAFTRTPNPETRDPILFTSRGTMEGRIGIPPRIPAGRNGFGYDPLFLVAAPPPPHHPYTKTGAELSSTEKNALSHRGMAARAMVEYISNTTILMK